MYHKKFFTSLCKCKSNFKRSGSTRTYLGMIKKTSHGKTAWIRNDAETRASFEKHKGERMPLPTTTSSSSSVKSSGKKK